MSRLAILWLVLAGLCNGIDPISQDASNVIEVRVKPPQGFSSTTKVIKRTVSSVSEKISRKPFISQETNFVVKDEKNPVQVAKNPVQVVVMKPEPDPPKLKSAVVISVEKKDDNSKVFKVKKRRKIAKNIQPTQNVPLFQTEQTSLSYSKDFLPTPRNILDGKMAKKEEILKKLKQIGQLTTTEKTTTNSVATEKIKTNTESYKSKTLNPVLKSRIRSTSMPKKVTESPKVTIVTPKLEMSKFRAKFSQETKKLVKSTTTEPPEITTFSDRNFKLDKTSMIIRSKASISQELKTIKKRLKNVKNSEHLPTPLPFVSSEKPLKSVDFHLPELDFGLSRQFLKEKVQEKSSGLSKSTEKPLKTIDLGISRQFLPEKVQEKPSELPKTTEKPLKSIDLDISREFWNDENQQNPKISSEKPLKSVDFHFPEFLPEPRVDKIEPEVDKTEPEVDKIQPKSLFSASKLVSSDNYKFTSDEIEPNFEQLPTPLPLVNSEDFEIFKEGTEDETDYKSRSLRIFPSFPRLRKNHRKPPKILKLAPKLKPPRPTLIVKPIRPQRPSKVRLFYNPKKRKTEILTGYEKTIENLEKQKPEKPIFQNNQNLEKPSFKFPETAVVQNPVFRKNPGKPFKPFTPNPEFSDEPITQKAPEIGTETWKSFETGEVFIPEFPEQPSWTSNFHSDFGQKLEVSTSKITEKQDFFRSPSIKFNPIGVLEDDNKWHPVAQKPVKPEEPLILESSAKTIGGFIGKTKATEDSITKLLVPDPYQNPVDTFTERIDTVFHEYEDYQEPIYYHQVEPVYSGRKPIEPVYSGRKGIEPVYSGTGNDRQQRKLALPVIKSDNFPGIMKHISTYNQRSFRGDLVDFGAATGGNGAFGWYTDHPVNEGLFHKK